MDAEGPALGSQPLSHPLEDLLDDEPSQSGDGEDGGTPDRLATVKSVESLDTILLESSPMIESVDLGSDSILLDQSHLMSSLEEAGLNKVTMEHGDASEGLEAEEHSSLVTDTENIRETTACGDSQACAEEESGEEQLAQGDPTDASQFFDALDESLEAERPANNEAEMPNIQIVLPGSPDAHSAEPTPIDFEEEKGEGSLKPTPSTKNLSKFFTDDSGGSDVEGKNFFDSFTAEIEEPVLPQSPNVSRQNSTQSAASAGLPPMSPQIASPVPVPQSPTPSPLHRAVPHDTQPPSEEISLKSLSLSPSISQEDDPFSASLLMSDLDRRHDAWLPCEPTRQVLMSAGTSQPGTFFPEPDHLTRPGILIVEPQGDPVYDLVLKFMGEAAASTRSTLTADSVQQDENGLRQLIAGECWRAAVDLTGRLLTQCGQGVDRLKQCKHTTYTLQLWFTRLALFMKLKMYSHVESELQAFGNLDRPDLYYEFYPDMYPGRRGSMVPFEMRVLHAELPQYLGKSQESLDLLYYVHAIVTKIILNLESGLAEDGSMTQLSNESRKGSRELWEGREIRVLYAITNCLLTIKDYATAIEVLESLQKKDEGKKDLLLCGIGRIYLQMGDVAHAQSHFEQVEKSSDNNISHVQCRNLINKGLLALGQNQFQEAHRFFERAMDIEPDNTVAINNMAVCSLYMGQLKQALATLEKLVHRDPAHFLQEGVLFNLCTLYELESSRALHKKQALLELVCKHKGNGFSAACLKMT